MHSQGPAANDASPATLLPCHEELVEGVSVFTQNYMQLGFLSRSSFLDKVRHDPASVSVFLLLSILALSARFTTSLVARFGSPKAASAEMRRRALSLLGEEMLEPTVERMQALFLLGVNDFGEGDGGRSWVSPSYLGGFVTDPCQLLTGIAIRMAATMRLHKEASYHLGPEASPEAIVEAEVARRSFWLVYCRWPHQIRGAGSGVEYTQVTTDKSPDAHPALPSRLLPSTSSSQPKKMTSYSVCSPTVVPLCLLQSRHGSPITHRLRHRCLPR